MVSKVPKNPNLITSMVSKVPKKPSLITSSDDIDTMSIDDLIDL